MVTAAVKADQGLPTVIVTQSSINFPLSDANNLLKPLVEVSSTVRSLFSFTVFLKFFKG